MRALIATDLDRTLIYSRAAGAADTVANSSGADPETNYDAGAMRVVAAVTVLMAVWWMTEAIPLAATALLPIAIFPLAGVAKFSDVSSPYASSTIFLFMGGFLMALGLQRWNLHRRIALLTVRLIGTKPTQMVAGFMVATGFLSMWVSNTATAVMMLPIGVSVLLLVTRVADAWLGTWSRAEALAPYPIDPVELPGQVAELIRNRRALAR